MLFQLHHKIPYWVEEGAPKKQFRYVFIAQRDVKANYTSELIASFSKEFRDFLKEMQEKHPLPEGAEWMVLTEKSEHFIKTHEDT